MDIAEIKTKWDLISDKIIDKGFKSVILAPDCRANLYLGINKDANRCLILSLPKKHKVDFRSTVKENLSIEFFPDSNYIVLRLIDNTFYELFDDLIISMYNRIKDIEEVEDYSNEFIQTFYKWSEFFSDKMSNLLSSEIIKGLFGELLMLKAFVEAATSSHINDILRSWTGPIDQRHDFTLDKKDVEVKTKSELKIDVTISSEYQLERNLEKELELVVISVIENEGFPIRNLIIDIKSLIQGKSGDYLLFLKSLSLIGINLKNASKYDHLIFKPVSQAVYSVDDNFPRIVRSAIPKEISSIKYKLRVGALDSYKVSEIYY
jgi:hypothetical protein